MSMSNAKFKVGVLGTCPVCEGEFKTHGGNMVHHGYQRPGTGSIHGDCFAVHMPAYELSSVACGSYRAMLLAKIAFLEAALAAVPGLTHLTVWGYRDHKSQYAVGVTDLYQWERVIESERRRIQGRIRECQVGADRMAARIAAWTAKPLREVTELAAETQAKAERDARAAVLQAKRDAKAAKSAALQAKRDAKDAARRAHVDALVAALKACGTDVAAARALAAEFRSKKNERAFGYLFLYEFVSEADHAVFVNMGLASWEGHGGRIHFTM